MVEIESQRRDDARIGSDLAAKVTSAFDEMNVQAAHAV